MQKASIDAGSVTSRGCTNAVPPASATIFAVSSRSSTRRAPRPTVQPRPPRATAIARPIPADAPVTTATRASSAKEFTAVDVEGLSGDHARPRRNEEHDAVRDLVLGRDYAQRDPRFDLGAHVVARDPA